MPEKIIVVGGSVAGCALAWQFLRLGYSVTILEKSAGNVSQGSGIVLPESIIKQCITDGLFDEDIPRLPVYSRQFSRNDGSDAGQFIWDQDIRVLSLNWGDVYRNLRRKISPKCYRANTEVTRIIAEGKGWRVETAAGLVYHADLLIGADGVDSTVRSQIIPESQPSYAGYIAYRGLIDYDQILDTTIFDEKIPYYVYPNGHLLLYRIPAPDFNVNGKTFLNWVFFEIQKEQDLASLLHGVDGVQHHRSLPPGAFSAEHFQKLYALADRTLPRDIANLIKQTPQPFVQVIFDFVIPKYVSVNPVMFVGDAAITLRPHTSSGVFKALSDSSKIAALVQNNPDKKMNEITLLWQEEQQPIAAEEVKKAVNIGNALVSDTPNWDEMNQALMDRWWADIMQGRQWYATKPYSDASNSSNTTTIPSYVDSARLRQFQLPPDANTIATFTPQPGGLDISMK